MAAAWLRTTSSLKCHKKGSCAAAAEAKKVLGFCASVGWGVPVSTVPPLHLSMARKGGVILKVPFFLILTYLPKALHGTGA